MDRAGAAPGRLIIVDQGLRRLGGHHAEYSLSVASCAAARLPVVILAHRRCAVAEPEGVHILPTFRLEWTQAQRAATNADYDAAVSFDPRLFLADLRAGLAEANAAASDHVFIHTIGFDEIEDLLTLVMAGDRHELPVFHILLRRDLDEIGGELGRRERFCAHLRAFAGLGYWPEQVRFYADTEQLSAHYAAETGVTFATLPIPFDEAAAARALEAGSRRDPGEPVIVGYLGNAREEKGYHLLPDLAEALRDHCANGRAIFRLHSMLGEAAMLASRQRLEALADAGVELMYQPLSGEEYYRRLGEMDILLLPYLPQPYRRRSSGIFAQAVAAGKIVVAPRGTTMWSWAERYGIASCIPFDGAGDLPEAVAAAIERSGELREAARAVAEQWLARRPTQALLDMLLGSPPFPEAARAPFAGPLVLHILNGQAAFNRREQAQAMALRIGALQRHGCRVATVIAIPACPTAAELRAWLSRAYRHWFTTGAAFCWLMYLTQPGEEPNGVAAELRNVELLSIPETLPAALAQASIDLIWADSLTGLAVAEMPGLPQGIPLVYDTRELACIGHALRRRGPLAASELMAELSLLRRDNLLVPQRPALVLYLPPSSGSGPSLAAFVPLGQLQAEPAATPLAADVLFLLDGSDLAVRSCHWFYQAVQAPHLAPAGVNFAIAGASEQALGRCDLRSRLPQAARIEAPVGNLEEAGAAGRVVVLPFAITDDLAGTLAEQTRGLVPFVTVTDSAADFAGQLALLVEMSLRPASASDGAGYLPPGAGADLREIEELLRRALDRSR